VPFLRLTSQSGAQDNFQGGEQIGYLPRLVAQKLAPVLDGGWNIEAVVTGAGDHWNLPIRIEFNNATKSSVDPPQWDFVLTDLTCGWPSSES
jgi:hypothetical protein